MLRASVTIGNVFQRLKSLPDVAAQKFQGVFGAEVKGELLIAVREIMEQEPGEPSSPFEFGTDLSARFYFWLVRHNPSLSDGDHWIRTGDLEHSWNVEVEYALATATVRVFNSRPDAPYVYGPFVVPGHKNTGWPDKLNAARTLVYSKTLFVAFDSYDVALYEAAKENGLIE